MRKSIFNLLLMVSMFSSSINVFSLQGLDKKEYSFELIEAFNGKIVFGGHKALFGTKKSEAETLYQINLKLKIEGLSKNKPIDFNHFSLVDHNYKNRHPLSWVSFNTIFNSYYVKKEKIIDTPLFEDTFLKYKIPNTTNYQKNELEANVISFVTKNSKSYKYLFRKTLPNKGLLRQKKINLYFYTKTEKTGTFSLYYKDRPIHTFTTSKKDILMLNKK